MNEKRLKKKPRRKSNKELGIVVQPFLNPEKEHIRANKILAIQRNNDIIAMSLDGKTPIEICKYLQTKYRLTANTAREYHKVAKAEIKKRRNLEVNSIISLHVHRYELIYKELKGMRALIAAMEAMKHKEKLLQFHREGFHMKVTKGEIQSIQLSNVDSEYDIDGKLGKEERKRLNELLEKANRDGTGTETKKIV